MAVDNRELYALAADLGKMPQVMGGESRKIFRRTALEVKNGMQADLRESRHCLLYTSDAADDQSTV